MGLPASLTKRSHDSLVREVLVTCNRLPGVELVAVDVGGAKRKHGTPGVSDIIGWKVVGFESLIVPGTIITFQDGKPVRIPRFVAFEIKMPGDTLRPAQRAFLARVNAANGIGLEIRDVMTAVRALQ